MSATLLLCMVIAVSDGDSMRIKCPARKEVIQARLIGIDAPEIAHSGFIKIKEQPWGQESRIALTELCLNQPATVRIVKRDPRYPKRSLVKVVCENIDANAEQVRSGNAWAYLTTKRSPLRKLEAEARIEKRGLWADPARVEPWVWRKTGGPG